MSIGSYGSYVPRPARPATAPPPVKFRMVAEVAIQLRVSKMTIYRLIQDEQLAAVRVGRSYRIPERAVEAYLRDHGLADLS